MLIPTDRSRARRALAATLLLASLVPMSAQRSTEATAAPSSRSASLGSSAADEGRVAGTATRSASTPATGAPSRSDFVALRTWDDLPAFLAALTPPAIPKRDFPITDFGARPNEDVTAALRQAIHACHAAGGGRVVVPAGTWLTGAVRLRSRVELHVAEGATLRFTFNLADYPIVLTRWEGVECWNFSPFIYALDEQDIAVTGTGTLDGGATWDTWWAWNRKADGSVRQKAARDRLFALAERGVPVDERRFGEGDYLRPNFIQTYRCRRVLIEGLTIVRSPMWEVHPVLSENVIVRGLRISSHGPNNDGCNPESSRNVLIEDCVFDTGDDCIAIKSGRNADGRRLATPTENLLIRRCEMKDGHGGVVLGSECSGGIRNVFVEHCRMDSPNLDRALRFKNNAVRGGLLENVHLRDIDIGRVAEAVVTIDFLYEEGSQGGFTPVVRHVSLERVFSRGSPRVLFVRGYPGAVIDDLRIRDSRFEGLTASDVVEHVGTIAWERVTLIPASAPRSRNSVPAPAAPTPKTSS